MEPKGGPRRSARRSATEKANVEESMARPVFAACPGSAKGTEKGPKSSKRRPNSRPENAPGRETEKVAEKEAFGSTFGRLWEPRGTRGGAGGHRGEPYGGRNIVGLLPFEGREKEPLKKRTRDPRGGMRGGPGGSFRGVSKIWTGSGLGLGRGCRRSGDPDLARRWSLRLKALGRRIEYRLAAGVPPPQVLVIRRSEDGGRSLIGAGQGWAGLVGADQGRGGLIRAEQDRGALRMHASRGLRRVARRTTGGRV